MNPNGSYNATAEFLANLRQVGRAFFRSLFRHGWPSSRRSRSQVVFQNFFLHIHSTRIHVHSLKWSTTLGLGVASAILFFLLSVTGVFLMFYYKPAVGLAYDSMKDIHYVVPTGRLMRNIHRWAAHAMVITVLLHMCRVFYTGAYSKPRDFNWVIGIGLLVGTLALSFTGYLLPWDQLAYWASTIAANIAESPREITDAFGITGIFDIGRFQKEILLGAHYVGQEALTRFYVLHIIILPLGLCALIGVHFWRIRKDGGLARPAQLEASPPRAPKPAESPTKSYGLMAVVKGSVIRQEIDLENTVPAWPNAFYAELALSMFVMAVMILLGFFFDSPLRELANPLVPENPAKAPWYFLGLQELVSYSGFMGGIGIPAIVVFGLMLIPYLDREGEGSNTGVWFARRGEYRVAVQSLIFSILVCVGMLVFTVQFGWLRSWFPGVPQIVITFVNPGTVFVALFTGWSIYILRRKNSTRMAAISLFTCFIVGFTILTYFAVVHRGPYWEFYWTKSQWPIH